VHYEGDAVLDHCGRPFAVEQAFLDEEGSVLVVEKKKIALLDDRDLVRYAASGERLPRLAKAEIPVRFGFVAEPADSLR